tara:strand:+ start:11661 stop:12794 length:1134 start_codon:yes stop_codon:yes gene_type:complete
MKHCKFCLLPNTHPFGIFHLEGVCSGCASFSLRKKNLPAWDNLSFQQLSADLSETIGSVPDKVVVPFDADGETWFVLDTLIKLGMRPVVVFFNAQYHDELFFSILSACQENFDADFIGFSLPKKTIQMAIAEEFSVGNGHCRNLEIFGRHAAALLTARLLGIKNIFSGPNQQSEVVGSHSFIIRNQLKAPGFNDIVLGKNLLPQTRNAITNIGSNFSETFKPNAIEELLEDINWHFLSDYVFWDSLSINNYYGKNFNLSPRVVNGFGPNWQSSSSSIKLEFFDLLRIIRTGSSKIDSYLSRDLRFNRMSKQDAVELRNKYLKKSWDIESIAQFLDVSTKSIRKAVELYQKKSPPMYQPQSLDGSNRFMVTSYSQHLC